MELNDNIHSKHEHASVSLKIILLVFAILLIIVLAVLVITENRISYDQGEVRINFGANRVTAPADQPEQRAGQRALTTFADETVGFNFKHPTEVRVRQATGNNLGTHILLQTFNLRTMTDNQVPGYDRATLTRERDALRAGTLQSVLPGLTGTKRLQLAETGDACSVKYEHVAHIYINDWMVKVAFIGDVASLRANNPTYFTTGPQDCGTAQIWRNNNTFAADVAAGRTDSVSSRWYKDFNDLLASFTVGN